MTPLFNGSSRKMAESILQSIWLGDQYCNGPPPAIYRFDSHRENWNPLLEMASKENMFNHCGFGKNSLYTGCCVNILDQNTTIKSMHLTQSNSYMSSSLGLNYCTIQGEKLFQKYQKLMLLDKKMDNPPCIESRLKCMDGIVFVFDASECNSNFTSFNLTNTPTKISIDGVEFDAFMETIKQGTIDIIWNTFVPAFLARPIPENLSFFISMFFTLMSIVGTLSVAGFYSYRYYFS